MSFVWAADTGQGVPLSDTPAAVQKTIAAQLGGSKVDTIDKITDDDGTSYAVELVTTDGQGKFLTIAESGALESIELNLAETPDPVQKTIKAQLGANQLEGIDKTIDELVVKYAVQLTAKDGQSRSMIIDPNGTLESIQMFPGEVPGAVQAAIKAQLGPDKLASIDKTFDAEEVAYEITSTTPFGHERDFTLAADGTLQSVDLALIETPPVVQAAIKAQLGRGKWSSIQKTINPDGTSYSVEMETVDGQARNFTIGAVGQLINLEVGLSETPAAVQATIAKEAGQSKVESIDKNPEIDGNTYDVTTKSAAGREWDFTVAENGTVLTREVLMENIPAPAQKTIREQIGTGHIIRIDRSSERESGVLPFVVQGRKNGAPFNFSVGPAGRFLGMDP